MPNQKVAMMIKIYTMMIDNVFLNIVDLGSVLTFQDSKKVKKTLKDAGFDNCDWRKLGEELGIEDRTMNKIEQNNPRDIDRQHSDCIEKWLNGAADKDRTYNSLADALENIEYTAAASYIREHNYTSYITPNHIC